MFGALARVVLLWGTDSFPGGSIGERVLRGPARKGITTVQRAGRDTPCSHNTSNHNNPRFTAFDLSIFPICAPGVEVGAQHAAPLPPPDPTCAHTMGESGSELLGTRHPAPPSRFSQICPLL